jgi:hypothetical protein
MRPTISTASTPRFCFSLKEPAHVMLNLGDRGRSHNATRYGLIDAD